MNAAIVVLSWWLVFALTHSLPAHPPARRALISRLGDRVYLIAYSLVSLTTFAFLVRSYWGARHTGASLWVLGAVPGMRPLCIALGLVAFALLAAALVAPSPVSMAGSRPEAAGITKITRHPLFMAMAVWGTAHLLMNGYATDVVFFGGFLVYGVAGALHQDYRKRTDEGDRLARFYRETSLIPLAALVTGKTKLTLAEIPWIALLLGVAMGVGVYQLHPMLFW
ncbi:MAG: hypothetical protein D6760_12300 [Deltaproteobacteria bacterium]|nr:MAG: hypothetical protein D6760_12300 [Deltaproteobacteria bacterium]